MTEQLRHIKTKLDELRRLDGGFSLFGSSKHRYKLKPVLSLHVIEEFEEKHRVKLPDGYVQFLTQLGNGGAGPYYGLEPFENVLFDDLDYQNLNSLLDPSKSFPHSQSWNMEFEPTADEDDEVEYDSQRQAFEETYYDNKQIDGSIAICNYGCAISLNLVVNGKEYGNVWIDDRASDGGIRPLNKSGNKERISFLDWYELWLDKSLQEIKAASSSSQLTTGKSVGMASHPWWKFW